MRFYVGIHPGKFQNSGDAACIVVRAGIENALGIDAKVVVMGGKHNHRVRFSRQYSAHILGMVRIAIWEIDITDLRFIDAVFLEIVVA